MSPEQELALEYALHTDRSIFLTGKAGTGKTTLVKEIVEKTSKPLVIVAPTGVAAINAGGVTIHSMFNLPLSAHVPTHDFVDMNLARNRNTLLSHSRFRREKLAVLRNMELLIVDEVSMVRCDILDAMDWVLRSVRRKREPFGGVQVMLIGDMYQLPPVVKDDEWNLLGKYYDAPYFFNSKVWNEISALHIELLHVYRQQDERFLNLLNNIRQCEFNEDDYELLKTRYKPGYFPKDEGYVLLTTHNYKADNVNTRELNALPGKAQKFEAEIDGEFPEHMYPVDAVLTLKVGAQIMFTRNDSENGRYYNGKLATVTYLDHESIRVKFQDGGEDYLLEMDIWENVSYESEEGSANILKKTLGTFTQYPIRLAWAVTIHKSQGLTFDKVLIDAGQSFASGQVYVALSRCRTLEGLVLHSLITPQALIGNQHIDSFAGLRQGIRELESSLDEARRQYAGRKLIRLFSFETIEDKLNEWEAILMAKDVDNREDILLILAQMRTKLKEALEVAEKFKLKLEAILDKGEEAYPTLSDRTASAIGYFVELFFREFVEPMHNHYSEYVVKARHKQYAREVQELIAYMWRRIDLLYSATFLDASLYPTERKIHRGLLKQTEIVKNAGQKAEKGSTYGVTLQMLQEGLSPADIAIKRGLAFSTIEGHFAKLIGEQRLKPEAVVSMEKIEKINHAIAQVGGGSLTDLKAVLDDDVSFGEIRMVLNHYLAEKGAKV